MDKILNTQQGIVVCLILCFPLFIPIIFNKLFSRKEGESFMCGAYIGITAMYLACKIAGL